MKSRFFVFVLIAVISCSAFLFTGCQTVEAGALSLSNHGIFGEQVRIPVKDFESLGLVFVQVHLEHDSRGRIDGDAFTFQKLLKEAHALGADSIINVVIDRQTQQLQRRGRRGLETIGQSGTWFASALAIRFTDTIVNHVTTTTTEDGRTIVAAEQAILNTVRVFSYGQSDVQVRDLHQPLTVGASPVERLTRWRR